MGEPKKKICFVVATDITIKFILLSELRFFRDKGYQICVVCSPGKWLEGIEKEGIIVKEINIKRKLFTPFSDFVFLVKLFFYFKKEHFDLVLTFTPKPGLLGQLAAKMAGVPVIINTVFGYYFHENTPWVLKKIFMSIETLAAKCSTFVFFRNKEDFKTAQKERIVSAAKAEYIGDGIDIEKYNIVRFTKEMIDEKKKRLGISAGIPVIGIVARLVKEKGYLELFKAFNEVLEKFSGAVLLVIGPVDIQKDDSINPANFQQKNIIFLGERTDADELYAVMDIFTLPSYREGFPHSVMEASASGLPVVTTDVRGCRSAVENNITGIIVPPRNVEKITEALIYLLSNPGVAKSMGLAARKKAEKDFDKNNMLEKMNKKIKELLP